MTRYIMPALSQRLDGFYCDVHDAYMSHIVLNNTPPLPSMARNDEALIKATGLNPHLSVCGWPFCLHELDDADAEEGEQ